MGRVYAVPYQVTGTRVQKHRYMAGVLTRFGRVSTRLLTVVPSEAINRMGKRAGDKVGLPLLNVTCFYN